MTTYNRDDYGRFKKGDFVINIDPLHRYYNQKCVIIALTGLRIREEDHSTFPVIVKGLYRFQEFKIQYPEKGTTILSSSEWFIKY